MLAEAAGQNTNVHRELSTILPSIRNIAEIRETNHAKIASLLVSLFSAHSAGF